MLEALTFSGNVFLTWTTPQQQQMGSLAGAAHLLKDNAGVPR